MKPELVRRLKWPRSRWLWIGYWAGLFVVMHVPIGAGGTAIVPHGDKIIHFGLYYLLTVLGGRHLLASRQRAPVAVLLLWAAVYAVYAAADEWLQPFVGREMSLGDWIADVIGVALATLTITLRRRSSEPNQRLAPHPSPQAKGGGRTR